MENNEKKNPIKKIIEKWKNMDSTKRFFIIVLVIVVIVLISLPKIYKGLEKTSHYIANLFHSKTSYDKVTCTQSVENTDYKTDLNIILYYDVNGLKKEDYTLSMKAISENGKNDLKNRQELYQELEKNYKRYEGFDTRIRLRRDTLTFNLVTNHEVIDHDKINEEGESETGDGVTVKLKLNQNIDSAANYYTSLGLTCRK